MERDRDERYNEQLRDLIIAGRVKPSIVVSHRLTLADAPIPSAASIVARTAASKSSSTLRLLASSTKEELMTERPVYRENDPRHHTAHLREMLQGLLPTPAKTSRRSPSRKPRRSSKRPPKYVLA